MTLGMPPGLAGAALAPLVREIPWREPALAFVGWSADPFVAFLDSAGPASERSRFSYIAVSPFQILQATGDRVTLDGAVIDADPFTALAAQLARFAQPAGAAPVPFAGGAVGFLGYELACHLEDVPRKTERGLGIPDLVFGFYDLVLAFDMGERRAWLISSGLPEMRPEARRTRAETRAQWLLRQLEATRVTAANVVPPLTWKRETPRAEYLEAVARVREYIAAGDIFQANFTARFLASRPAGLHAADLYTAIRRASPAPFAAYLGCGKRLAIASASPERFIRLTADGRIESRPIKGTRPRGPSPEADSALSAELQASDKDRAENLMIVDLLRNDIGRVAEIGSVRVPRLAAIESFAAVHHLVSAIEGRLRPGLGPVDLLRASFPGGSITGAPKIRAMQIIAELEQAPRGPYCGAIAWIGFDGAMDSNIAIRTVTVTPETIAVQAGGGIVWDSDPADEHEEMMVKVRPLLRALGPEPP